MLRIELENGIIESISFIFGKRSTHTLCLFLSFEAKKSCVAVPHAALFLFDQLGLPKDQLNRLAIDISGMSRFLLFIFVFGRLFLGVVTGEGVDTFTEK